jgi:hypothetical protein
MEVVAQEKRTLPKLTVITRACQRPKMLIKNIQSVQSQTCKDWEQVFIIDNLRRGVKWANEQFYHNRDRVIGEYVFMLDDDCRFIHNGFVQALKKITVSSPDLVMVRTRRPQFSPKELPRKEHWKKSHLFKLGSTNGMCYVTKSELWKANTERYFVKATGDWQMLKGLLPQAKSIVWLDMFASETQQLGRGKLFEVKGGSWFSPVVKKFNIENLGDETNPDWRIRYWQL